MTEHEEDIVLREFREALIMFWFPDGIAYNSPHYRVVAIETRKEENDRLCAILDNGTYAVLWNAELPDFVTGKKLVNVLGW